MRGKSPNVNVRCLRQRAALRIIEPKIEGKEGITLLSENIRAIRKSKGLSQEELAVKLNVVRQTISKWEQGLSVPDSDMLIALSEVLETPVSTLLGEKVAEEEADGLKTLCEKLEVINLQLAKRKSARREALFWLLVAVCAAVLICFIVLTALGSQYQDWDWSDPELAIVGTAYHAFEWVFIRIAPLLLMGAVAGIILIKKKG